MSPKVPAAAAARSSREGTIAFAAEEGRDGQRDSIAMFQKFRRGLDWTGKAGAGRRKMPSGGQYLNCRNQVAIPQGPVQSRASNEVCRHPWRWIVLTEAGRDTIDMQSWNEGSMFLH